MRTQLLFDVTKTALFSVDRQEEHRTACGIEWLIVASLRAGARIAATARDAMAAGQRVLPGKAPQVPAPIRFAFSSISQRCAGR